ncbi:hypothetical protein OWM54_43145 [Myxococcus sp. MISCRS1]|uniref:hypothetical protein n=1 Tax=Myxococcus sp. MISCRS1 TaxID=2996786 RepID=UPI002270478B|nr:hypothetical protein [Myxococcus sp. MISCRS1]MCY1003963.1 hypothetical protein [Myxococcus sp. MISCRS1]
MAQALALAQGRARRPRRRPVADEELVEDLVGAARASWRAQGRAPAAVELEHVAQAPGWRWGVVTSTGVRRRPPPLAQRLPHHHEEWPMD